MCWKGLSLPLVTAKVHQHSNVDSTIFPALLCALHARAKLNNVRGFCSEQRGYETFSYLSLKHKRKEHGVIKMFTLRGCDHVFSSDCAESVDVNILFSIFKSR